MIGLLRGKVIQVATNGTVLLEVAGTGLALQFRVPQPLLYLIGQEVSCYIYCHWNQEQGPTLYGFATEQEQNIFELIVSCAGIGPKIGLAVLSKLTPAQFIAAIMQQNLHQLSSINGIGHKKAEQLVLLLRNKIEKLVASGVWASATAMANLGDVKRVADTLQALHYQPAEIHQAISFAQKQAHDSMVSFEQVLRDSLSFLAKKG